jgi:RimJ/RimL family protein N-acetyltransferase
MPDLRAAPRITTQRLLLREWQDPDRHAFAQMNADPRVSEFLVGPVTRADSDDMVDRIDRCWRERGYGLWATERRDSGTFIGYVGLWPATFDASFTPAVEVGWRLAPAHWGNGFATEGALEAMRYGFEVMDMTEIVSFTAAANERSWRVMQRLGMSRDPDGDFEHPAFEPGDPSRRQVLYRLDRDAWLRSPS